MFSIVLSVDSQYLQLLLGPPLLNIYAPSDYFVSKSTNGQCAGMPEEAVGGIENMKENFQRRLLLSNLYSKSISKCDTQYLLKGT